MINHFKSFSQNIVTLLEIELQQINEAQRFFFLFDEIYSLVLSKCVCCLIFSIKFNFKLTNKYELKKISAEFVRDLQFIKKTKKANL